MKRISFLLTGALFPCLFSSCATTGTYVPVEDRVKSRNVHYHKPRTQGQVDRKTKADPKWWLSNADEDYDSNWKPHLSHEERKRTYAIRNPGHNLTHYVIGVADKDFVRYGKNARGIWAKEGRVNTAMIHAGPLRLPFVSYRGPNVETYFGWREKGNFGMAFRKADDPNKPKKKSYPVKIDP